MFNWIKPRILLLLISAITTSAMANNLDIGSISNARLLIVSRLPLNTDDASADWTNLVDKKTTLNFYCDASPDAELPQTFGSTGGKRIPSSGEMDICTTARFLSTKGNFIRVVYVDVQTRPDKAAINANPSNYRKDECLELSFDDLSITQAARKTAIQQNLNDFAKFLIDKNFTPLAAAAAPSAPLLCTYVWKDISLTDNVGTVTIKAAAPKATGDSSSVTAVVITGKDEHWFLTGDAVVTSIKQLKYDTTTHSLTEQNVPSQLYLGINYMRGDLYTDVPGASWDRVVYKVMVAASKTPFNSIGLGLGYRFADGIFTNEKTSNSGFEVWAGRFWTKEDQVTGTVVNTDSVYAGKWAFGISYSLGTLMNWIK